MDKENFFEEIYNEAMGYNKVHLTEIAQPWSKIALALDVTRPIRHEHLIKLYYYKSQNHYDRNFDGWIDSAKKGFEDVPKEKSTNKYPSFDKLYKQVWLSITDSFSDFHDRKITELNNTYTDFEKIETPDLNGVMNFISQFNKWACERISQVGGVEIGEVKSKIKELLGLE